MDHGDLLRDCRHMLLAISSQISLLLAGLQRLEGQQRHPQPPPPPPIPDGHPPPLPPPSTTPPHLPATSGRPDYMAAPVTLVATSDNRAEHPAHVRTVSVIAPPGNTDEGEDLGIERTGDDPAAITDGSQTVQMVRYPRPAAMLTLRSIHRRPRPCQLADHQVCRMNGDGAPAIKVPQRLLHACLHAPYLCHAAALQLCSFA